MTHLIEGGHHLPCTLGYMSNYGYGYNNNNHNNNNDDGLLHLLGGQRELTKSVYEAENDIRTNLDSIGSLITDGQSRLTTNVTTVSRDVLNAQHGITKDIGDSKFFTSNAISDVRQEIAHTANDVNKEIAHSRLQISQVANDVAQNIATVKESLSDKFAILLLENHKAESRTREELLKGFATTQLDACKNTNEITRQASDNFASLQAKIAECCCETQKALLVQSASIRELALSIENNRLRDKCDNQERHSRGGDIEIAINNVLRNTNFSRS
jgi:hypothetical protein